MRLFEMYNPPVEGYQDPAQDQSKWKWTETRKTKLTLRQIRKLRKMLDVRNYEYSKNLKKIRKQYEPVAEETPSL